MITHGAFKQRDDTEEQRPLLWQSVLKSMMVTATLLFLLCGCTGTATYGDVRTGPTLSASFINQVLASAGSPAIGLGDALYQLSEQYQIDDAVALAFFHHDSGYGKDGVAASTHSLGNIRCTAGYACDPTGGYRMYRNWRQGAADWYQLITTVYLPEGRVTVASIIPKYAPSADHNDEQAYINSVLRDVSRYQRGEVS